MSLVYCTVGKHARNCVYSQLWHDQVNLRLMASSFNHKATCSLSNFG